MLMIWFSGLRGLETTERWPGSRKSRCISTGARYTSKLRSTRYGAGKTPVWMAAMMTKGIHGPTGGNQAPVRGARCKIPEQLDQEAGSGRGADGFSTSKRQMMVAARGWDIVMNGGVGIERKTGLSTMSLHHRTTRLPPVAPGGFPGAMILGGIRRLRLCSRLFRRLR